MASFLTDEALIKQYLPEQPNQCFETLYNRYVNKVYRHCLSMTKDEESAHDYTHDIFIKMFKKLDTFHERSSFSTWLYSIAYNYCSDQLRLAKRLNFSPLDDEYDTPSSESYEAQAKEQSLQLLNQVMEQLPEKEQKILKLKYEQGLRIDEIAQLYNISESSVKMRLKRSREKVHQLCAYYHSL
ncbi:RNA polymerase sigma factor [Spirosoma aerolatum]|uniref:RNA polymerase sigma factor n=1 Tax=Spirosoma aerolatum TaxID=1211326 RepID=UPI0009AECA86|nr:RNA polymerase sigma factor [Spirosoma aerolatum]